MYKLISALTLSALLGCLSGHIQTEIRYGRVPSRGVNLGGWLVTEKWMTGSSGIYQGVPDDIANRGEHAIMKYLGHDNGDWRYEQHRKEWITEADIAEIASFGLNTVRVPVGYWIAGEDKTGGTDWQTFAPGAINHLDTLIKDWANKHNIAVMISMHAAKGSQNGNDHSAAPDSGKTYWSQYPENVQNTIDVTAWLAERYRNEPAFLGIGLLNEPTGTTDSGVLHKYYQDAYAVIRATGNDCVLTHAPLLYQQDPSHDGDFMPTAQNAWHEWHKYILWGYEGQSEDQILWDAVNGISSQITQWTGNWMFIGEWSVATNDSAPFTDMNKLKQLISRMIEAMNKAHSGWTYWTWKCSWDESGLNKWSLRALMRNGAFPHQSTSTEVFLQ